MTTTNLIPIDDAAFEREVLGSPTRFLLDVTAKWCGPCRTLLPIVHALAAERAGSLRVGTLDVDEAVATATALGIRGAPTLILFEDGREIARHLGAASARTIRELVDRPSPQSLCARVPAA